MFYLLYILLFTLHSLRAIDLEASYLDPHVVHNATLNHLYTAEVNQSSEYLYEFSYNQHVLGKNAIFSSKTLGPICICV